MDLRETSHGFHSEIRDLIGTADRCPPDPVVGRTESHRVVRQTPSADNEGRQVDERKRRFEGRVWRIGAVALQKAADSGLATSRSACILHACSRILGA